MGTACRTRWRRVALLGAGLALLAAASPVVLGGDAPVTAVTVTAISAALLAGTGLIAGAVEVERDGRPTAGSPVVSGGPGGTRRVGYALCWLAFVATLWAAVDGLLTPSAPVVVLAAGVATAVAARSVGPETRPTVLAAGGVAAVGGLVAAVAWAPLAGAPLPDVGVFGPYTYLATEVTFGALAAALLVRAGRDAAYRAGRTVAAVYPLAYVWDWYTLEVGVFAVPLRTGVELVGIPLEEHLFMVVVPALVLGVHETLDGFDRSG